MSLLLLALLLFLLFGGSRVGAAGKGLGQAARHVKRAVQEDAAAPSGPSTPAVSPPVLTMTESESPSPKLLPAKGESSARSEDTQE